MLLGWEWAGGDGPPGRATPQLSPALRGCRRPMQDRIWGIPSASPSCSQGPGASASLGSAFILRVSADCGPAQLPPCGLLHWVPRASGPHVSWGPTSLQVREALPVQVQSGHYVSHVPQAAWRLQDAGPRAQRPQRLSSRCPGGQTSRTKGPAWQGLERSPQDPSLQPHMGGGVRVTFTFHFHALEKEMETHFSVLAWRIPGIGSLVGCCLWGHTESDNN